MSPGYHQTVLGRHNNYRPISCWFSSWQKEAICFNDSSFRAVEQHFFAQSVIVNFAKTPAALSFITYCSDLTSGHRKNYLKLLTETRHSPVSKHFRQEKNPFIGQKPRSRSQLCMDLLPRPVGLRIRQRDRVRE